MNQLFDCSCPSTSAEPVLAPMLPVRPDIAAAAVPLVAVRFIICRSWATVPGGRPWAVASSRPSRLRGTITGCRKAPVMAVAVTEAMFSGFICTSPCPIMLAAVFGPPEAGTAPSNEGTPVFQSSRPIPKRSCASLVRESTSTSSAYFTNAVLQERAKLSESVAFSCGAMPVRLWKVRLCQTAVSGQGAGPVASVMPWSMSVAAETIFMVEPGATLPRKAALNPSSRWLATASTSPVLGFTATTDDSAYCRTACSAAACTPALSVVRTLPALPFRSVSSVRSAVFSSADRTASSMPGVPPALSPYFSRSWSRTGPREGYFSFVSTVPFRSTASTGGLAASPVTRVSPSSRPGYTTPGRQSTSAFPVVSPRTTVSSPSYFSGLLAPSYDTVADTSYGTVAPTGLPGVMRASVTCASSPYPVSSCRARSASLVYPAAVPASPAAQAARNFSLVSLISALVGGPVRTGAGPADPPPSTALTMLYAPYPAVPTMAANTPPTMAPLTPLRIPRSPPRSPCRRTFLNAFKKIPVQCTVCAGGERWGACSPNR